MANELTISEKWVVLREVGQKDNGNLVLTFLIPTVFCTKEDAIDHMVKKLGDYPVLTSSKDKRDSWDWRRECGEDRCYGHDECSDTFIHIKEISISIN